MQKKADVSPVPGTVIQGKWNQASYTMIREIGRGMIGTVYLCRRNGQDMALKLSSEPTALTREAAILKTFNEAKEHKLGPFLFDVDDWEIEPGHVYAFYVMEYIKGISVSAYIKQHGSKWLGEFLIQLLETLEKLHEKGMVYGDLKNDNLLVTGKTPVIRFVDVGGVTKIGQSVKEYSNFYDRAYWQQGTRKAEPRYDLFALVMVVLAICYPKQFPRTNNPKQQLYRHLAGIRTLQPYEPIFKKALNGNYISAQAMKEDIIHTERYKKRRHKEADTLIPQAMMIALCASAYYAIVHYFF